MQNFFKFLFNVFLCLSFVSVNQSYSNDSNPESEEQEPEKRSLDSYYFYLDPSLNISMGLEKNQGDVYLIIEMDHNPTRNDFTFRFDAVVPDVRPILVGLENLAFGFKNKPFLKFPMIEIEGSETSSSKFIIGSKNFRTHQRVNLSKILRELADNGAIFDSQNNFYKAKDIRDFKIVVYKPFNEKSGAPTLKYISIEIDKVNPDLIEQIYGQETLSDLKDNGKYKPGDQIHIKPNFKLPYRSSVTQWVIVPEESSTTDLTYKLIDNPKIGDFYQIKQEFEIMARVLPKTKPGTQWTEVSRENGIITYELTDPPEILSPNVLMRYVQSLLTSLQSSASKGIDLKTSVMNSLKGIPIEISDERLKFLTERILKLNHPKEIVDLLLNEQYEHSKPKPKNSNRLCSSLLGGGI